MKKFIEKKYTSLYEEEKLRKQVKENNLENKVTITGRVDDDVLFNAFYFACKAVGDLLLEVMGNRPHNQLTVLCGHTHHDGVVLSK